MNAPSNQNEDKVDRISNALLAGRKIEAIKAYQEMTGMGLRESKEAIDAMEASLQTQQPEAFSAKQKSPVPVIAVVVALILLGVVFAIFSGN
jgi:ribosomal protein L7/L12